MFVAFINWLNRIDNLNCLTDWRSTSSWRRKTWASKSCRRTASSRSSSRWRRSTRTIRKGSSFARWHSSTTTTDRRSTQVKPNSNRQFNCKMKCYLYIERRQFVRLQLTTLSGFFKQKKRFSILFLFKNRLKLCELFYFIHEMLQWKLNPIILF